MNAVSRLSITNEHHPKHALRLSAVLACVNVMLGNVFILRLVYLSAALAALAAILFLDADNTRHNIFLAASLFVIVPILLNAPFQFRYFVASTRFSLAPSIRFTALISLMICVAMAVLLASLVAYDMGASVRGVAAVCALAFTLHTLIFQAMVTSLKRMILSFFALGIASVLATGTLFHFRNLSMELSFSFLIGSALALWVACAIWLGRAKFIAPVGIRFADSTQNERSEMGLINLWDARVENMGQRALMHGMVDSLRRRISLHATLLFGFPAGMILIQLALNTKQQVFFEKPFFLLFTSLYALMMAPIVNGDWLIRTRYLWLRMAGTRTTLFWFWAKSMLIEKAVSTSLFLIYAFTLLAIFDFPPATFWPFILTYILLDVLCSVLWTYVRMRGYLMASATSINLCVVMTIAVTLFILGKFGYWVWLSLLVASMIASAFWLALTLQKHFERMDWSAIKPLFTGKRR